MVHVGTHRTRTWNPIRNWKFLKCTPSYCRNMAKLGYLSILNRKTFFSENYKITSLFSKWPLQLSVCFSTDNARWQRCAQGRNPPPPLPLKGPANSKVKRLHRTIAPSSPKNAISSAHIAKWEKSILSFFSLPAANPPKKWALKFSPQKIESECTFVRRGRRRKSVGAAWKKY